jgi:diaminohydroxyphosphoribosylaminopyrimidine deaminase / 5-amino-6-(5-phosphoribosylamino)uracil reductase
MTPTITEDLKWMRLAIDLSRKCPQSEGAYSVGAVIVNGAGEQISFGYSREFDPHVHAEESAVSKLLTDEPGLKASTIYSTLEPCSQRKSRPRTCTQLILEAGISRVVIAWREPSLFVADCQGYEILRDAGVVIIELPDLAAEAKAVNAHLDLGP